MLDMLGEDARAAVGKVKSLQSKGATPDQVQAQMMEAARNGLLPLSVAFAAQKALQRQNATPAPQGTVVGDMLQQLNQPQQPREQGIAGLPNPMMDNAQFAGGGVVAFAEAGSTGTSKKKEKRPLTPAEEAEYQQLKEKIYSGGPVVYNRGIRGPMASTYESPELATLRKRFEPRFKELESLRTEWEEGAREREAVAGAEQLSQQAGLGALPAAPEAPAAAAGTDAAATGLGALDPNKLKLYSRDNDTNPDRSAFAGIRAPRMGTAGYDQAVEQAVSQFAPTAQEIANANKTRDQLGQEEADRFERLGIGAGRKKQLEKNAKKREDLEGDRKRSKLEEIGLGFLTEGVAAASRGESTLGSLASGFGAGLKGAKISKEKLDAAEDKLDEQEAALDAQGEALALQGDANGLKMYEMHQARIREGRKIVGDLRLQQAAMRVNVDQFNIGNEFKLMLAEASATAAKNKSEKEADVWIRKAGRAFEAGDKPTGMEYLRIAAGFTAAGSGGVQVEQLKQAGKAAETAALTGNPAGAQAGGGTWGKSTVVNQ